MKLAEWRENEAHSRNVPRNRILKDDAIYELARLAPTGPKELARARSIPKGFERSSSAEGIINAVKAGAAIAREDLPALERHDGPKAPADVVELLKVLLKTQCEQYGVAPKLIANVADLEAIALGNTANVAAMKGWRREVFGEAAENLKQGKLALKLDDVSVKIIDV